MSKLGHLGSVMISNSLRDNYGYKAQWKRFRQCNAWVSENDFYDDVKGEYFGLVKSYDTIVAVVEHSTRQFRRIGKWSQTTSRQCTQIHKALYPDYEDIQL